VRLSSAPFTGVGTGVDLTLVCPGMFEIPFVSPTPEQVAAPEKFEGKEFPLTTINPIVENGAKNGLHPSSAALRDPGSSTAGVVGGPSGTGELVGDGLVLGKEIGLIEGGLSLIGERIQLITTTVP
jgi:hypothetical protein